MTCKKCGNGQKVFPEQERKVVQLPDVVPLYRWLGVLWYGYPMPLRTKKITDRRGCGCVKVLKDFYLKTRDILESFFGPVAIPVIKQSVRPATHQEILQARNAMQNPRK